MTDFSAILVDFECSLDLGLSPNLSLKECIGRHTDVEIRKTKDTIPKDSNVETFRMKE